MKDKFSTKFKRGAKTFLSTLKTRGCYRKKMYLFLLVLFLLPSQYLMVKTSAIYPSHDGLIHIQRIEQYKTTLMFGQIPPRLTSNFDYSLGFPMFVANYHLPYAISSAVMFISDNPVFAFKVTMSISFLLSGIFMFLFLKSLGSNLGAFLGALVFTYSPYRFANLYTRGAFGESVALMFVPAVLFFLKKIADQKRTSLVNVIGLSLTLFGLITSHTIIFLIFSPLILFCLIWWKTSRKKLAIIFTSFLLGLSASAFQILPIAFERKYLTIEQSFFNLYPDHLLNIFQILRIPSPGVNIGTPFQLGLGNLFVLAVMVLSLIWIKKKIFVALSLFLSATIFIISDYSLPVWRSTNILGNIVYPWRFLSLASFLVAIMALLLTNTLPFKKLFAAATILIVILSSRHYFLRPTQYVSTKPEFLWESPSEFMPVWATEHIFDNRQTLSTSNNQAKIQIIENKPFTISAAVTNTQPTSVIYNKLYFPGWNLLINGNKQSLKQKEGLNYFDLQPGTNKVIIFFRETPIRTIGNYISVSTFIIFVILVTLTRINKKTR